MEEWKTIAGVGIAILCIGMFLGIYQGSIAYTRAAKTADALIAAGLVKFGTQADKEAYISSNVGGVALLAFFIWGFPLIIVGIILIVYGSNKKSKASR